MCGGRPFRQKFLDAIDFIPRTSRVVVAVSGGADSVALLWMFRSFWGGEVVAAHAEHGIRGSESLKDAEFVAALAKKLGVECVVRHLDVPNSLLKGESVEMGARRLRYEFLEKICAENEAFGVALGHNRDDVAETFLLNLFRGTGVRGLAGIPFKRGVFFRPLLGFSHEELCELLREHGLEWREDATNFENDYLRNKIRNILLPAIKKEINPRVAEHIVGTAEDMSFFRSLEEAEGERILQKISANSPDTKKFDLKKIRALGDWEIKFFLRELARKNNIKTLSRERTNELVSLLRRSGRFVFQWQKNFVLIARDGIIEIK